MTNFISDLKNLVGLGQIKSSLNILRAAIENYLKKSKRRNDDLNEMVNQIVLIESNYNEIRKKYLLRDYESLKIHLNQLTKNFLEIIDGIPNHQEFHSYVVSKNLNDFYLKRKILSKKSLKIALIYILVPFIMFICWVIFKYNTNEFKVKSIIMHINIFKKEYNGKTYREVDVRTIYYIETPILFKNKKLEFIKEYKKSAADSLYFWKGSESEKLLSSSSHYTKSSSSIALRKKDEKSIIFGTNVLHDLENPKTSNIRDIIHLNENEAWWGYPNNFNYKINNITIVLESKDFDLSIDNNSTYLIDPNNNFDGENMIITENESIRAGEGCIVANWENVKSDFLVALKYNWE